MSTVFLHWGLLTCSWVNFPLRDYLVFDQVQPIWFHQAWLGYIGTWRRQELLGNFSQCHIAGEGETSNPNLGHWMCLTCQCEFNLSPGIYWGIAWSGWNIFFGFRAWGLPKFFSSVFWVVYYLPESKHYTQNCFFSQEDMFIANWCQT